MIEVKDFLRTRYGKKVNVSVYDRDSKFAVARAKVIRKFIVESLDYPEDKITAQGLSVSAVMADCGIHALNMACFVTGQEVASVSADFVSCIDSRSLEDDAMVSFRMTGGCAGRLWTSAVAVGRMHGLNIQVFGEKGGLRWAQEWPNQLFWTPLNGPTQILERGAPGLSPEADRASRVTIGHAEGISLAFANIYCDLAEVISAGRDGRDPDPAATHVPTSRDGLNSVAAVYAAVDSAKNGSAWTRASPPMVRDG